MEVRFLELQTVSAEQLTLWENWLSPEKRQRLEKLPPEKRLQSLCGDALARQMLSQKLGIAPEKIDFSYTEKGKPLTDGACFSISHSGSLVGCAVSERPVGLDLEQVRTAPTRLRRELDCEGKSDAEFFHLWTKQEALLKCCGETVAHWRKAVHQEENYTFSVPEVPEGYCVCVCEEK